jgi:RNA polymerase sigma-70 factor (ECF subfamily)
MKAQKEDLFYVIQAQLGIQRAFTVLYNRYQNSIRYFVYTKVHNTTTAEDLTIEILTKAFLNIKAYKPSPNATFKTWLYRIATNHCIDYMKSKQCRPKLVSTTEEQVKVISEIVDSLYPNPEQILISRQEAQKIMSKVIELNPSYGDAFVLFSFSDLSTKDIAYKLNISSSAVTGKVRLARRNLSLKLNTHKKFQKKCRS